MICEGDVVVGCIAAQYDNQRIQFMLVAFVMLATVSIYRHNNNKKKKQQTKKVVLVFNGEIKKLYYLKKFIACGLLCFSKLCKEPYLGVSRHKHQLLESFFNLLLSCCYDPVQCSCNLRLSTLTSVHVISG